MTKKKLGRTGLNITQLGFGSMELRGPTIWNGREVSDAQAEAVLNAVLDAGINFIDTSPDYGLAEQRIGKFISGRRKEYFLATKCGCDPHEVNGKWETPHTWTRDRLMRNIDESLRAMKTDHVDILQLHNPRGDDVDMDLLVATLKDIQAKGLTRFIGVSHTNPFLDGLIAMGVFDTFQIPYSCLEAEHFEALSKAAASGAGVIVRGGIAKGGPQSDVAIQKRKDLWTTAKLSDVAGGDNPPAKLILRHTPTEPGASRHAPLALRPAELILRHTLSHPACHTTIVGTLNVAHLKDNIAAADKGTLPKDLYEEVRRRVAAAKA